MLDVLMAIMSFVAVVSIFCLCWLGWTLTEQLKNNDYWVSGFSEHAESELEKKEFSGKNVLIFGNEEKGLRSLVEKNCDDTLKITQKGKVSSLNVSIAVSIGLHNISNKL